MAPITVTLSFQSVEEMQRFFSGPTQAGVAPAAAMPSTGMAPQFAPPATAATVASPSSPPPPPPAMAAPAAPQHTKESVLALAQNYVRTYKAAGMKAVLQRYGVEKIPDASPGQLAQLAAYFQSMQAP